MSSGVFKGNASGTGVVTLETPNTNSDITIALPARAGNLMMDGPSFSAYQSTGGATLNANTRTKLALQTEEWDTANCFDSTTNYRFTPNVPGYYQINGSTTGVGNIEVVAILYKNGTQYKYGGDVAVGSGYGNSYSSVVSSLVYLNGSTDYIELYIYTGSATTSYAGIAATYLNGFLARGA